MSIIFDLPDDRFAGAEWDMSLEQDMARSRYTGSEQVSDNAWHARWTLSGAAHVPIIGEANIRPWNALKSNLNGRENRFRFFRTETEQRASGTTLRASAAVSAGVRTLPLDGMPVSAEFLPAGSFLTLVFANGEEQLVVLRGALTANGGGAGSVSVDPPLRYALPDNAIVHYLRPWAVLALDDAMPIRVGQGQQYSFTINGSEARRA